MEKIGTGDPGEMQFGFFFNQSRCSGCFTCVIACKQWHSVGHEVMNWRRVDTIESGTFPELKTSFLSLSCLHCQTPCCISVCPASAILKREEDGVVLVDSEKCLGQPHCGVCKDACPYRIPQFNPDHDLKMEKCNFCRDRMELGKQPVCVDACPMHALDAAPLTELSRIYGNEKVADGFHFSKETTPSIVLKRRK